MLVAGFQIVIIVASLYVLAAKHMSKEGLLINRNNTGLKKMKYVAAFKLALT